MPSLIGTYDLGSDGKTVLVGILNAKESTNFTVEDFIFSSPEMFNRVDPSTGEQTNSLIKLNYLAGSGNYGIKTVFYNRILATAFSNAVFPRNGAVTLVDLIPSINSVFGIAINPNEVANYLLPEGESITAALEFVPTSIIYMGSSVVTVGNPPTPSGPVIYFLDNFNGTQGASVVGRVADTGQTWSFNSQFLQGDMVPSNSFILDGVGGSTRPTFDQDNNSSGGEFLAYPQDVIIPDGTAFSILVSFKLNVTGNNQLLVYQNSANAGNSDVLFGFFGFNPYADLLNVSNKTIINAPSEVVAGQTYLVRLDIDGVALSLYVDDVLIVTGTRNVAPVGSFGIDLVDSRSEAAHTVDFFKIVSL